jgi:hypothetical protein
VTWSEFEDELRRRRPHFWWRDDDAGAVTPALQKLLQLSKTSGVPVALAVVPQLAQANLFVLLHENVTVLQHGTDHRNRAAADEKKTEYPKAEPAQAALARISDGLRSLRSSAGEKVLPVLAPPWNRMRKDLLPELPAIGIDGVSAYGARTSAEPAPGLRQVNTHVDIVAWRRGQRFVGEAEAFSIACKYLSGDEPVGWLTHHAVHDDAAWNFLERLFAIRGVRWLSAAETFSYTAPAHG